jgi:uncharacterized protein (TIGR00369 family)
MHFKEAEGLTPPNPNYQARVQDEMNRQGFTQFMQTELIAIRPGHVELRMPFQAQLGQHNGFFHGGAVGALADNAGGHAAFTMCHEAETMVTIEYKINFMAPAVGDYLIGKGYVIRAGRQVLTTAVEIFCPNTTGSGLKVCAIGQQSITRVQYATL